MSSIESSGASHSWRPHPAVFFIAGALSFLGVLSLLGVQDSVSKRVAMALVFGVWAVWFSNRRLKRSDG